MSDKQLTIQQARDVAVQAQQDGNHALANAAYAQELQILAQDADKTKVAPVAKPGEVVDHLFNMGLVKELQEGEPLFDLVMEVPDLYTVYLMIGNAVKLMEEQGRTFHIADADVIRNENVLGFLSIFDDDTARSLVASVQDFPRALTIAKRFLVLIKNRGGNVEYNDVFDEPDLWKFVIPLCERIAERLARPSTKSVITPTDAAAATSRDEFLETMQAFADKIQEYKDAGRSRDANRVYQEQMAWIASLNKDDNTDNRIIGSAGRTV